MKPTIKIFILCVLSILLASFQSLNASAIISDEVHASDIVSGQIYFRGYQANGSWTSWLNSSYTSTSIQSIRKFQLRSPSNASISSNWGDYFTIPVYVLYPGVNGQWNTVGNVTASAENVNCPIRDITMSQTQSHVYNGSTDSKQTNQRNLYIITCQVANANYTDLEINFQVGVNNNNSGTYTMNFVGGYTRWRSDSQQDYSTMLNTINNSIIANNGKVDQVKNAINNLGSKIDDTNDKLDDIKNAQDQANQDAQDRYDQEKQEEQDREQQGQEDSSDAQSLFNFNVLNPFGHLWDLFNDDGCVNIPTIAGMVHSQNTVYCNWFDSNVRSITTPVISIASAMLLFGFVVRWLSGNSGDIYGARNMNKELNG